jgi:hypothetical protein
MSARLLRENTQSYLDLLPLCLRWQFHCFSTLFSVHNVRVLGIRQVAHRGISSPALRCRECLSLLHLGAHCRASRAPYLTFHAVCALSSLPSRAPYRFGPVRRLDSNQSDRYLLLLALFGLSLLLLNLLLFGSLRLVLEEVHGIRFCGHDGCTRMLSVVAADGVLAA